MIARDYIPSVVLAAAMIFFAYDIVVDILTGGDAFIHIGVEFVVFVAISLVLSAELKHVRSLTREISEEKSRTARLAGELLDVIHKQFDQWGLSGSEKEIALLLVKGLSMKEIAELRQVKEKTIRQQATSIYAKSGHTGRHELTAHFIEDLMSQV